MKPTTRAASFALALLLFVPLGLLADEGKAKRSLSFDRYHRYEAITQELTRLHRAYPAFTSLSSIGRSWEKRPIWMLTIRNPLTGNDADKAAIYVDGNMHGNEIQGTEVALYLARQLLEGYPRSAYIRRLVNERVFYIAPCVNPDGREAFFRDPNTPHSSRSNRRPRDDDRDGRLDEDGYEDLDGDGEVLQMRVRDPLGRWKTGADPREMLRCKPDEIGQYRMLGWEGIDNDGDGRINEDPVGGIDLNRNFPSNWKPEHIQRGAGDYPLSEPETRAVAEFILGHRNIAAIQSFHNAGDMILRPPSSQDDRGIPRSDIRLYDALGRRGERSLPGYRYLQTFKDLYACYGTLVDWGYMRYGVFTFTNELWSFPSDYNKDGRVSTAERLRWNDEMLEGRAFRKWKRFRHPQLGDIELGGWVQMAPRIPPGWMLKDVCHRNARFVLYHADMMPQVTITDLRVFRVGEGDLYRVEAVVENRGRMPTATARARQTKVSLDDRIVIEGEAAKVLALSLQGPAPAKPIPVESKRPWRVKLGNLPSQGRQRVVWLVRGRGPVMVTLTSQKGGRSVKTVVLGL